MVSRLTDRLTYWRFSSFTAKSFLTDITCLLSNLDYVEPIHRIGRVSTEDKNVSSSSSSSNRTPASVWTRPYIYLSERTPISITQPDSGHLFHRYQPLQKTSQHNDKVIEFCLREITSQPAADQRSTLYSPLSKCNRLFVLVPSMYEYMPSMYNGSTPIIAYCLSPVTRLPKLFKKNMYI